MKKKTSKESKDSIEISSATCKVRVWGDDLKEVEVIATKLMDKYGVRP